MEVRCGEKIGFRRPRIVTVPGTPNMRGDMHELSRPPPSRWRHDCCSRPAPRSGPGSAEGGGVPFHRAARARETPPLWRLEASAGVSAGDRMGWPPGRRRHPARGGQELNGAPVRQTRRVRARIPGARERAANVGSISFRARRPGLLGIGHTPNQPGEIYIRFPAVQCADLFCGPVDTISLAVSLFLKQVTRPRKHSGRRVVAAPVQGPYHEREGTQPGGVGERGRFVRR